MLLDYLLAHETPRHRSPHRKPRPGGGGGRGDHARGRVHRLQRQRGAAVRAHLRPQGQGAQREQARGRQRRARRRLPHRRGRPDQRAAGAWSTARRRSVAVLSLKLDKAVQPLARGHARGHPLPLGARPQVRRAQPGHVGAGLPGGRHDPAAQRAAEGAARSRTSRRSSTTTTRVGRAGGAPGLRQRAGRPGHLDQPGDRGAQPAAARPDPGHAQPLQSAHRAGRLLPAAGPRAAASSPRWPACRPSSSPTRRPPTPPSGAIPRRCARRSRRDRPRCPPRSARCACRPRSSPASPTCRAAWARRARQLRISLPPINEALRVGTPVLLRVPELGEDLERLSGALEDLGENPSTLLALQDLRQALRVTAPLIEFAAPYQTVCNYFVYFWTPTGAHLSQVTRAPTGTALGTVQRILSLPPSAPGQQPHHLGLVAPGRRAARHGPAVRGRGPGAALPAGRARGRLPGPRRLPDRARRATSTGSPPTTAGGPTGSAERTSWSTPTRRATRAARGSPAGWASTA